MFLIRRKKRNTETRHSGGGINYMGIGRNERLRKIQKRQLSEQLTKRWRLYLILTVLVLLSIAFYGAIKEL